MSLVYKEVFEDGYPVECEWVMEADSADLHKMRDQLRAHAAALEEVERLNAAWKAQQFHLEAEERESAHWQERAEKAERRAERLKAELAERGEAMTALADAERRAEEAEGYLLDIYEDWTESEVQDESASVRRAWEAGSKLAAVS